jgi:hypothetical protein
LGTETSPQESHVTPYGASAVRQLHDITPEISNFAQFNALNAGCSPAQRKVFIEPEKGDVLRQQAHHHHDLAMLTALPHCNLLMATTWQGAPRQRQ